MISKKRGATVSDPDLQRAINDIYNHLNELIDAVNQPNTEAVSNTGGKEGDIRVISASEGDKLQIRTKNGWADLLDGNNNIVRTKIG